LESLSAGEDKPYLILKTLLIIKNGDNMEKSLKEQLEDLKNNESDYSELKLGVIKDIQDYEDDESIKSHLNDIVTYGLEGGAVAGLVYYSDTHLYYDNFYYEIEKEKTAKIEEFRDSGEDRKEVLQWFRVSSFLYSWLRKFNEVVLETVDSTYWGRTCCGQAIFLDHVMQQIAKELPEGYFN
jgi:hypothetical protein